MLATQSWYWLPRLRTWFSSSLLLHVPAQALGFSGYPHFWVTKCVGSLNHPPPRFNNSTEWLTELSEALYLQLQFYYKGYKWGSAKGSKAQGKIWQGPRCEAYMSLERVTLLTHQCMITNQGSGPEVQMCIVFPGSSLGRNGWLHHWPLLSFSEVSK